MKVYTSSCRTNDQPVSCVFTIACLLESPHKYEKSPECFITAPGPALPQ